MEVYPNLNWLEALFNWHLWEVNLNKHFVTGMASYKVNTKCEMTFLVICEQATLLGKSYFLFGFLRRLLDFLFCSCRSHRYVGKNQNGRFDEISSKQVIVQTMNLWSWQFWHIVHLSSEQCKLTDFQKAWPHAWLDNYVI